MIVNILMLTLSLRIFAMMLMNFRAMGLRDDTSPLLFFPFFFVSGPAWASLFIEQCGNLSQKWCIHQYSFVGTFY